ncbi:MAG: hypothetical protein BWY75_01918 [bacterium ADurb.Bin425]|jgi:hypothetical protein|nr:MAG: hypothetical protein BWY75_01918 [bacterium ADurb.Bin425]
MERSSDEIIALEDTVMAQQKGMKRAAKVVKRKERKAAQKVKADFKKLEKEIAEAVKAK